MPNKKLISPFIFLCLFISTLISFAEENVDLNKLTSECIEASKKYTKIKKPVAYKVLHTVEYEGWSGDSNTFDLHHPVAMTIRYAGAERTGSYWFLNNPQKKYLISAKTDFNGNIELVEDNPGGHDKRRFRGLMKDGIIKGAWEQDNGENGFAFYVRIINEKGLK